MGSSFTDYYRSMLWGQASLSRTKPRAMFAARVAFARSFGNGDFVSVRLLPIIYEGGWSSIDLFDSSALPGQFFASTFVLLTEGSARSSQFAFIGGKTARSNVTVGEIFVS